MITVKSHQSTTCVRRFFMHYGQFLSHLRRDRGLSQSALAERARISVEAVRLAETAERKGMYPRTFLGLISALHSVRPLSTQDIPHFAAWSGMSVETLVAALDQLAAPPGQTSSYVDLPPLSPLLTNALAACLLKMSQTQLSDILYEVTRTLTRAQLERPLPRGTASPTTITGPGLLGLQHPEDNGYKVTVFFEPRPPVVPPAAETAAAAPKRRKAR